MSPKSGIAEDRAFEPHLSVAALSSQWRLSKETIRKLVMHHPRVLKLRIGPKKAHTYYSIPLSVAREIYAELQKGR